MSEERGEMTRAIVVAGPVAIQVYQPEPEWRIDWESMTPEMRFACGWELFKRAVGYERPAVIRPPEPGNVVDEALYHTLVALEEMRAESAAAIEKLRQAHVRFQARAAERGVLLT